jgi:2-methylcitrate dehydratase PrpD
MVTAMPRPLARALATGIVNASAEKIPDPVRGFAVSLLVNWMGCALGGCRESSVEIARSVLLESAGAPVATVIGRDPKVDILTAALLNSLSASSSAFNEAHSRTSIHPVGPIASAIMALGERRPVSGPQAILALLLGIEVACRIGAGLIAKSASTNVALSPTGLVGSIGAAVGAAKVLALGEEQLAAALGLAAIHAGGFRETIGSMSGGFVPGHSVQGGLLAALLAAKGYTCTDSSLDGAMGLAAAFGNPADLANVANDLESYVETMGVACKPYPCGMWVQPVIDICLSFGADFDPRTIDHVEIAVHPRAIEVAGRRNPTSQLEAVACLSHWAAAALIRRRAGIAEGQEACIFDPTVRALAERITFQAEPSFSNDQAEGTLYLAHGKARHQHIRHCRGGPHRPMTEDEINAKFLDQAEPVLGSSRARRLLGALGNISACDDIAALLVPHLTPDENLRKAPAD